MSGLIETAGNDTIQQNQRLDELLASLNTQLKDLDTQVGDEIKELANSLNSSDANLYQRGLDSYELADLTNAARLLRLLLQRYPSSGYAHASHYWLGVIAWEQGSAEVAHASLIELLAEFPDSSRIPDALLLLEEIATSRDNPVDAKHWSRMLLTRYPSSAAADRHRMAAAVGQ